MTEIYGNLIRKQLVLLVARKLCDIGYYGEYAMTAALISKFCYLDPYIAHKHNALKKKKFVHKCANFGCSTHEYKLTIHFLPESLIPKFINKNMFNRTYTRYMTSGAELFLTNKRDAFDTKEQRHNPFINNTNNGDIFQLVATEKNMTITFDGINRYIVLKGKYSRNSEGGVRFVCLLVK